MNIFVPTASLILAAALASSQASAQDEYRLDDGVKETGIGIQSGGSNSFAWLNTFTAEAGAEVITAVNLSFGSGLLGNNIANNTPVSVYIWGDFNQDGNPNDAFLMESGTGFIQGSGTNAFTSYALTNSVSFVPGTTFFAGAIVNYTGQHEVASLDTDGTDDIFNYPAMNHSWIAGGANGSVVDPNFLNFAQLPLDSVSNALYQGNDDATWMIRLNGTSIPSPGTITLLGFAGLCTNKRRR